MSASNEMDCTCRIVGWARDHAEPHVPAQPEWEQADDCPVHPMTTWRPGDRARVLFRDGVRRPAELTAGFVWVSLDGDHQLNAVGGFDAEPLLAPAPRFPPAEETR